MSKSENRKMNATRRDLLKIAPLAGAAAVAGNRAGADAPGPDTTADDHRQVRLADTDHVRTFYKLARE